MTSRLPCPFCGGDKTLLRHAPTSTGNFWMVQCTLCFALGPRISSREQDSELAAQITWNNRTDKSQSEPEQ
jgi:hypothetical protein